jgi:hypothetical protein
MISIPNLIWKSSVSINGTLRLKLGRHRPLSAAWQYKWPRYLEVEILESIKSGDGAQIWPVQSLCLTLFPSRSSRSMRVFGRLNRSMLVKFHHIGRQRAIKIQYAAIIERRVVSLWW